MEQAQSRGEAQAQRPEYPEFKFQLFLCVMQDPEVFSPVGSSSSSTKWGRLLFLSLVCILYGEGRGRTELRSMTLSKSSFQEPVSLSVK